MARAKMPSRAQMPRVLIIEDEALVRSFIELALTKNGFDVIRVGECVQPSVAHDCHLDCCGGLGKPDVVIAAVITPRLCSGIEAAAKAVKKWDGVKLLLISASPADFWPRDARAMLETLPVGSYSFLAKPFSSEQLRAAVTDLAPPRVDGC